MHQETLLRLIQEDRRREMAAAARARLVRRGRTAARRPPLAGPARRSVGRLFVRFGVWLAMTGSTSSFPG